jgi:CO/xanthine dehydrogenase FAD-binding subunit
MQTFSYVRPETVAEAVAVLERHGSGAHLLAGGTDLVIALREGWVTPEVVVDLKRVAELQPEIRDEDGTIVITAGTVMDDVASDERIRCHLPALAEAAEVVGSVQIRNRATLAGNICNCSPAADTAPPLLVYGAEVVVAGPAGTRRVPIDEFIVGPNETGLEPAELVTAIEVPLPKGRFGSAYLRHTRRKGTDLASITLCCAVDESGTTRLAYGSVGPRPFLVTDHSGVLADPNRSDEEKAPLIDGLFHQASPSPRSMRSGPEYRLAMLRVLGARALRIAIERYATSEGVSV